MCSRVPVKIEVDFDRPEQPTLVYDDPPEREGEGDAEDDDFITMIACSLCEDGCIYVRSRCVKCGELAPWVTDGREQV